MEATYGVGRWCVRALWCVCMGRVLRWCVCPTPSKCNTSAKHTKFFWIISPRVMAVVKRKHSSSLTASNLSSFAAWFMLEASGTLTLSLPPSWGTPDRTLSAALLPFEQAAPHYTTAQLRQVSCHSACQM